MNKQLVRLLAGVALIASPAIALGQAPPVPHQHAGTGASQQQSPSAEATVPPGPHTGHAGGQAMDCDCCRMMQEMMQMMQSMHGSGAGTGMMGPGDHQHQGDDHRKGEAGPTRPPEGH